MPQRSSLISNRALVGVRQDFAPRISLSKFRPSPIIVQQLVETCTLTVVAKKIVYFFPFHESAKNLPRTVASRCLRRLWLLIDLWNILAHKTVFKLFSYPWSHCKSTDHPSKQITQWLLELLFTPIIDDDLEFIQSTTVNCQCRQRNPSCPVA